MRSLLFQKNADLVCSKELFSLPRYMAIHHLLVRSSFFNASLSLSSLISSSLSASSMMLSPSPPPQASSSSSFHSGQPATSAVTASSFVAPSSAISPSSSSASPASAVSLSAFAVPSVWIDSASSAAAKPSKGQQQQQQQQQTPAAWPSKLDLSPAHVLIGLSVEKYSQWCEEHTEPDILCQQLLPMLNERLFRAGIDCAAVCSAPYSSSIHPLVYTLCLLLKPVAASPSA